MGGASNEIWNLGAEAEAAIARVLRLRETLRPYVASQYERAARSGMPIVRPLFFDFWDDAGAQGVDDQLMFGPDYLVAPQLTENAIVRSVYLPKLPAGCIWQNVFTGALTDSS